MRRGRVLVVEQGEGLWGAQRYLLRLAPQLEARGFELVLAAPPLTAVAQRWTQLGREHFALPALPPRSIRAGGDRGRPRAGLVLRKLRRSVENARALARLADSARCDVIHANSHWSHLESALAGRLARRPVVLHLHEETAPGVAGQLRGIAVRLADATVAVSEAVAKCVPGWARSHVQVIHNGVDAEWFRPGPADPGLRGEMSADPGAFLVLVTSRLDPRKGVDHVIRAVASLAPEVGRIHVAVAGATSLDHPYAEALKEVGRRLLGERLRFLGMREDVPALVRAADLVVLASSLEGLPLSILEAQASATPVVAYPAAGIPEVVEHERTGLLARQDDVEDLAACIARMVRDPALRERLAARARGQVVSDFSLQAQAAAQAALLRRLLDRPPFGFGSPLGSRPPWLELPRP